MLATRTIFKHSATNESLHELTWTNDHCWRNASTLELSNKESYKRPQRLQTPDHHLTKEQLARLVTSKKAVNSSRSPVNYINYSQIMMPLLQIQRNSRTKKEIDSRSCNRYQLTINKNRWFNKTLLCFKLSCTKTFSMYRKSLFLEGIIHLCYLTYEGKFGLQFSGQNAHWCCRLVTYEKRQYVLVCQASLIWQTSHRPYENCDIILAKEPM